MAAGSKVPLALGAAASALPTARIRLPSESLAPSRAPPMTWFLALGSLLAIAPIYLVAISILAGDAVGVSLFAVPLWIAAMLAIAAAVLFMRSANPAATAVAMVAIAAAISTPARESGAAALLRG